MTLRCECGGAVEIESGTDHGDGHYFELYRCPSCDRTGTLTHRHGRTTIDGCLTRVRDGGAFL